MLQVASVTDFITVAFMNLVTRHVCVLRNLELF